MSINHHEKKSPLKQFKRQVTTIVNEQLSQISQLQSWLQEQGLKNFKCQVRKLIRIAMGPNGVQRPIGKEDKQLRRCRSEILENILGIYGRTKTGERLTNQFSEQQIQPQVNYSKNSIDEFFQFQDKESQIYFSFPSNDLIFFDMN